MTKACYNKLELWVTSKLQYDDSNNQMLWLLAPHCLEALKWGYVCEDIQYNVVQSLLWCHSQAVTVNVIFLFVPPPSWLTASSECCSWKNFLAATSLTQDEPASSLLCCCSKLVGLWWVCSVTTEQVCWLCLAPPGSNSQRILVFWRSASGKQNNASRKYNFQG